MKKIENNQDYRTELKFTTKKEIREFLDSCESGYILSHPITNGVDRIEKEDNETFTSFAAGFNWCDAGKSYHTKEVIINSVWRYRAKCWINWV